MMKTEKSICFFSSQTYVVMLICNSLYTFMYYIVIHS